MLYVSRREVGMSANCALRQVFLSLVILVCTVSTASAQGVGAICRHRHGCVRGRAPGATVTLTSAQGTVGGNREVSSDERGAYPVSAARSRHLQRESRSPGIPARTHRAGITVNSDQTSRADARLEIGRWKKGIVVSGEAPLLDTSSAFKQTVLTQEVLESAAQPHGRVVDHARDPEHRREQG